MSMTKIRVLCMLICGMGLCPLSYAQKGSVYGEYKAVPGEFLLEATLFSRGMDGVNTYRIPALVTTTRGTVLAVCDGRVKSGSDAPNNIDLVMKRSFDNGRTWERMRTIVDYPGEEAATDPCLLVDRQKGVIWLFYDHCTPNASKPHGRTLVLEARRSCDDGQTWSEPIECITRLNKQVLESGQVLMSPPGIGIQLRDGRLAVPARSGGGYDFLICSDDHGETWRFGGKTGAKTSEGQLVELADGTLMCHRSSENVVF
jgi:sialidase-1